MSFCSTIEQERRWKMRGFAMLCIVLTHKLLELKINKVSLDENGQTRLFKLTTEDTDELTKFAANLRFLKKTFTNDTGDDSTEDYWEEHFKHDYPGVEFFQLVNRFSTEVFEAAVTVLEKAANGSNLTEEELMTVREFMHALGAWANHAADDHGGCF